MKKYTSLKMLLLILVTSCTIQPSLVLQSPTPDLSANVPQQPTEIAPLKITNVDPMLAQINEPDVTSTPPESCIPIDVVDSLPLAIETGETGKLILRPSPGLTYHIYYDLSDGSEKFISSDQVYGIYVSPDHQKLAYDVISPAHYIVVADSTGTVLTKIPDDEWTLLWGWLDNEHLMITRKKSENQAFTNLVILGLKDQSEEILEWEILPDYNSITFLDWQWNRAIYDPSLAYVVYVTFKQGLALYDLQEKKILASVPTRYPIPEPLWSPDGSKVLVAGDRSEKINHRKQGPTELYLLEKNGNIEQISHFNDDQNNGWFWGYSWSPDGQKIAVWFTPNEGTKSQLNFIDLRTKTVIKYCVFSYTYYPRKPVWSPDSKFAVVSLMDASGASTGDSLGIVWIDLESKEALYWENGTDVEGWLNSP